VVDAAHCHEQYIMMRPYPNLPKIYLCIRPVDFRKAIRGLSPLVEQALELSPFETTVYVFINRCCEKLKILYWETNDFCLWYKRLENSDLSG
jgi:transposase